MANQLQKSMDKKKETAVFRNNGESNETRHGK